MNLLSKETLIGVASLGAGAVIAKVVHQKVLPLIPVDIIKTPNADKSASAVQNLITLAVGIATPIAVKGAIGKGLGAGMIATSVAGLVEPMLRTSNFITGTDTFMGDVLMGETESGTLMGASENIFDSPSTDFTGADAGEMDY
jgi:hypothetical protein